MKQHVTEYLAAYFDGELDGKLRQKVVEHLESCPTCRLELKQLKGLSALLKECPPVISSNTSEQFAAQVGLRLPRTTTLQASSTSQRAINLGWLAIPICIAVGWVFMQTVLLIISGVNGLGLNLTSMSRFFNLVQWINEHTLWGLTNAALWDQLRNEAALLDFGEALVRTFVPSLAVTVLAAIFLCCWMVSWWVLHQQQEIHRPFTPGYR